MKYWHQFTPATSYRQLRYVASALQMENSSVVVTVNIL